jgi:exonuclease III
LIWRRKDKTQASRIDMILLGNNFLSLVHGCKIKPAVIQCTDHQRVVLTFNYNSKLVINKILSYEKNV